MPYGIPDAAWIKLPPDDQAAIIAQSKGQAQPAPTASTPLPPTSAWTVAPPTKATPAPPSTLMAQPTSTTVAPSPPDLSGDVLALPGRAVAARPGVTVIRPTPVQPPAIKATNPTQPTPATPAPPPSFAGGDVLALPGFAVPGRPGVTVIHATAATVARPPTGAAASPSQPTPAPQRTLQALGGAVPGLSQKHVIGTISFGPLEAVVTQQASATVSWSGGKGQPSVELNPSTGDLSVSDHGLTFTDPGVLGLLAKNWRHDTADAEQLILSGKSEFSAPVINAPSFDVSVAGTKRKVAIDNVVLAASIMTEDGDPAIELEASTVLAVPAPPGQTISVKYAITTTYRFEGPKVTPLEIEALLALAALAGTAILVTGGLIYVPDEP